MAISVIGSVAAGSGGGPTKFVLRTGVTGNRTFTLNQVMSAGQYTLVSTLSDTTFDVYFVTATGEAAGYSNLTEITASLPFSTVVIFGAGNNDTFTFERFETKSAFSSGEVPAAGAFITSATPTVLVNVDTSTTITGGNFATNVEIYFRGNTNVVRQAKSVTRNSLTSVTAVRPDTLPVGEGPYDIIALNPNVPVPTGANPHILNDVISASPILATGGTIVVSGGFVYHTFLSSGTFSPTSALSNVELLVVAGGGGAGDNGTAEGGGGAGGIWFRAGNSLAISPNTITVGAGGAKGFGGSNGSNSSFGTLGVAIGGGGGGTGWFGFVDGRQAGSTGGSGGGSVRLTGFGAGGSNQGSTNGGAGFGFAGGVGAGDGFHSGGGGGGAGAVGGNAAVTRAGGIGRLAYSAWATATSTGANGGYYAGGGGSVGGLGGGGALSTDGTINTGGGGGPDASGASGIVIVRYPA